MMHQPTDRLPVVMPGKQLPLSFPSSALSVLINAAAARTFFSSSLSVKKDAYKLHRDCMVGCRCRRRRHQQKRKDRVTDRHEAACRNCSCTSRFMLHVNPDRDQNSTQGSACGIVKDSIHSGKGADVSSVLAPGYAGNRLQLYIEISGRKLIPAILLPSRRQKFPNQSSHSLPPRSLKLTQSSRTSGRKQDIDLFPSTFFVSLSLSLSLSPRSTDVAGCSE